MSAKKQEIGDPLERAATTGMIGGKKTADRSDVQYVDSLEVQRREHSDVQGATSRTRKQRGGKVKLNHGGRVQHTVYLSPTVSRRLKVEAAQSDGEMSDIVDDILRQHWDIE